MSGHLGQRAVVVGAGIGGLSTAGALAKYFERVEIMERDQLTASPASRSGTPQDRHPHGLLAGGLQALGEIFPGFEKDLAGAGAVPVSVAHMSVTAATGDIVRPAAAPSETIEPIATGSSPRSRAGSWKK